MVRWLDAEKYKRRVAIIVDKENSSLPIVIHPYDEWSPLRDVDLEKITITKSDGVTILGFEIDGEAIWIKTDLAKDKDTKIYVYFNKDDAW